MKLEAQLVELVAWRAELTKIALAIAVVILRRRHRGGDPGSVVRRRRLAAVVKERGDATLWLAHRMRRVIRKKTELGRRGVGRRLPLLAQKVNLAYRRLPQFCFEPAIC